KKKKLYIIEEYVKQGMLNDEIANVIKQLGYASTPILTILSTNSLTHTKRK
ncbi:hypothetical protein UGS_00058, partial [Staphylococcus aureus M0334]